MGCLLSSSSCHLRCCSGCSASEAGLNLIEIVLFSVVVFAGASQFAALQMLKEHAPVLIILVTALAVNLRMMMYSVALAPHLGRASLRIRAMLSYFLVDQSFAMAMQDYDKRPDQPLAEKVSYFFGAVTPIVPTWTVATIAGALVGRAIPEGYALDFAVPIAFLAMTAPMLRTRRALGGGGGVGRGDLGAARAALWHGASGWGGAGHDRGGCRGGLAAARQHDKRGERQND